jgi:hypothetical protein
MKTKVLTFVLVLVLICLSGCEKKSAGTNPPVTTAGGAVDILPQAELLARAGQDDLLTAFLSEG